MSPKEGCSQGQLERDVQDPEERRARDLQAQRGMLALTERFLILHASKAVALMMFWAAMAQPGAIGWLLLGRKPSGCKISTIMANATVYSLQGMLPHEPPAQKQSQPLQSLKRPVHPHVGHAWMEGPP